MSEVKLPENVTVMFEIVSETKRQFRSEFETNSLTQLTIARIRDMFEGDRIVQTIHTQRLGRPQSSKPTNNDRLIKYVRETAVEVGL